MELQRARQNSEEMSRLRNDVARLQREKMDFEEKVRVHDSMLVCVYRYIYTYIYNSTCA